MSNNKNILSEDIKKNVEAVQKIVKEEIDNTAKDEIKKKLLKIYFPPYSNKNIMYQFIYNDYIKNSTVKYDEKYIIALQSKIADALKLRAILKKFEISIYLNDNGSKDELLPRKRKLNRIKQMYELLVDMSLILIHNFFYVKPLILEENTLPLEECIKLATPIILTLKESFETEIHNELLLSTEELKLLRY